MYLLRLFHQADPSRQIASRLFKGGELVIGRDPVDGWKIDDPDRQISRAHCTIALGVGGLMVRDTSANGVMLGQRPGRLPPNEFVPLPVGERLLLGGFSILVEQAPATAADPFEVAHAAPSRTASPFEPPPGLRAGQDFAAARAPDPFASALPADPLAEADPFAFPGERRASVLANGADDDVWARPERPKAGDWNNLSPAAKPNHEVLIGSDRAWSEPPPAPRGEIGFGFDAPFHRPMLKEMPVSPQSLLIPSDWEVAAEADDAHDRTLDQPADEPEPVAAPPVASETSPPVTPEPPAPRVEAEPMVAASPPQPAAAPVVAVAEAPALSAGLFEAFCEGANLDPREFSGEDPAAVLKRAGAVYQQMVLGLGDLLSERTSLKNEYRMIRTTVAVEGNNPFKWSPPRRVAVDLLRGSNEGFLQGPAAVRESFEDLKKHLLCLLAGMRASLASTLSALSPTRIESRLKASPMLLRGNRGAAAWTEFGRVFADFQQQADDNADSQINRDFRAAYERQLRDLDGLSARK